MKFFTLTTAILVFIGLANTLSRIERVSDEDLEFAENYTFQQKKCINICVKACVKLLASPSSCTQKICQSTCQVPPTSASG